MKFSGKNYGKGVFTKNIKKNFQNFSYLYRKGNYEDVYYCGTYDGI